MMFRDISTRQELTVDELLEQSFAGLHFDSRKIQPGDLFVAIPGVTKNGHDYMEDAIYRGASAIIGEMNITDLSVPYFFTQNARLALAKLAESFYQNPSNNKIIIGITGTNGKTTTAYLLRHIIEGCGISCGLFGTISYIINGVEYPSNQTTPDPIRLQEMLYESKDKVVVMEVSSHGIDQDRVSGLEFDYCIFTNLSHDHMDYHKNMEEYFEVKKKLFSLLKENGEAIIGSHCSWGERLINSISKTTLTFGDSIRDDIQLLSLIDNNLTFRDDTEYVNLQLKIPGLHNAWNVLAAYLTAKRIGLHPIEIVNTLECFPLVPGRYEEHLLPNGTICVIDYAHTPEGLKYCLQTTRERYKGKITHIFGFRGNRDPLKRKEMVNLSILFSNETILTQDDLNNVDPNTMHREMLQYSKYSRKCKVIDDRTLAIRYAYSRSQENDVIIITGKGPEKYKQNFALPSSSDKETIEYLSLPTKMKKGINRISTI